MHLRFVGREIERPADGMGRFSTVITYSSVSYFALTSYSTATPTLIHQAARDSRDQPVRGSVCWDVHRGTIEEPLLWSTYSAEAR